MEEKDLTILQSIPFPKGDGPVQESISNFLDQRDPDMPGSNYVIEHFNRND